MGKDILIMAGLVAGAYLLFLNKSAPTSEVYEQGHPTFTPSQIPIINISPISEVYEQGHPTIPATIAAPTAAGGATAAAQIPKTTNLTPKSSKLFIGGTPSNKADITNKLISINAPFVPLPTFKKSEPKENYYGYNPTSDNRGGF